MPLERHPYKPIDDPATDHFYCPQCEWLLALCKCPKKAPGK